MKRLTTTQLHYLLTINALLKDERKVRCIDVAVMLGVARATASRMIGLLIEKKLLWQDDRKCLYLTADGKQQITCYTTLLNHFSPLFTDILHLSREDTEACSLVLSTSLEPETLQRLVKSIKHISD